MLVGERMDERTRVRISKKMTFLLRHKKGFVDKEGWVDIERLYEELRRYFPWIQLSDILYVVSKDEKGRFEVKNGKIRARYGHTIDVEVKLPKASEKTLYHGTSCEVVAKIMKEGIVPMRRKKVHLTASLKEAIENAKRKGNCIKILEVDCECLERHGHEIFKAGRYVRVTDYVPPECIRRVFVPKSEGREG
ncbi:RNA 2'-phosphotransferase [Ignicoccus pacificus DSM 13166]|uniref:Probable RNA 2'-phosphotransferase n=1 Tax=Ignicoccus pacificus DSM 13166 TaxID=940294 RepID=A0A977K9F2_9CREN|nr:RNA 2'-phosphotransferase [Ignicoccus pacificus DSM 13166]